MKAKKVIAKTLVVFIPVILVWVYIAAFPARYMDGEYSYFTWAKQYRLGKSEHAPADILVLGDSRAKSAFVPELLSDTCMNLAEGGTTSIEAYYTLSDYLANVGTPKAVILSVSPYHFTSFDGFWTRSVYFDYLSAAQAKEVLHTAASYGELAALEAVGGDSIWTLYEYKCKAPTKYISPILNSFGENRKETNRAAFAEMEESRGFKTFVSWWPTSAEHDMQSFVMLETLNDYYIKTLQLCKENNISFYSVNTPLIADTRADAEDIVAPLTIIQRQWQQGIIGSACQETGVIDANFYYYDNLYFDDADHLNRKGAERYTRWFIEQYFPKGGLS